MEMVKVASLYNLRPRSSFPSLIFINQQFVLLCRLYRSFRDSLLSGNCPYLVRNEVTKTKSLRVRSVRVDRKTTQTSNLRRVFSEENYDNSFHQSHLNYGVEGTVICAIGLNSGRVYKGNGLT